MTYNNISEKVQAIIKEAEESTIKIGGSNKKEIAFNQRNIISKIDHYINNKYFDRDDDALFWNISNPRITHFAKLINVDTKDFMPYGEGEYNYLQAWALRKKLREWFNTNEFYKILNDVSEGLAIYGSQVWKKCKKNGEFILEEVDLLNLYFDQTAKNINDTPIVETHELSDNQLWDKMEVWDNVEKVLKKNSEGKVSVWEFYGYCQLSGDKKPVKRHVIGSGFGDQYIKLFEEELDKDDVLYYDFHLGKYRGRWLRVGVVERLFKLQARANQLVNQNAQVTEIASLLLFRSQTGDVMGNVLEQAVNGQIISSADIEQIGITNTGLQQFINELQLIEQHANMLCLTPDIIQGEPSPSNTTFRGIATINAAAISAFTAYKQDLGEKIANILMTEILPYLCKKWNKGIIIEIAEDDSDVEMYDTEVANQMKREHLLNGMGAVTPDVDAQIKTEIESNIKYVGRRVKTEEGDFNFKYGLKMMPTNETVDKAAQNDAYFNAIQMMGQNPALINLPLTKQYLENNGISWWKLTNKEIQAIQAGQVQGAPSPEQRQPDQLLAQANAPV